MSRRQQKRKTKKNKTFFRVFLTAIIIFLVLGAAVIYAYNILNKLDNVEIPTSDIELGIGENVMENKDVMNIALFGLDEPDAPNGGRSDSIMIASLDKVHKKIKLTSVMRDTYVDIPGHGKDKINHAHSFGGPELAIRTINQNFDMDIREFVTVDFFGLEKIIDTLGGIQVDVKPSEVEFVNMGVRGMNRLDECDGEPITDSGLQLLTGRQAVSYSRIRKTGDGDFERTERQRFVLETMIHKGLKAGLTQYPALLDTTLPYIKTSLKPTEILSLGKFVLSSGINEVDKYRVPLNKYLLEDNINGVSYLVPNTMDDNIRALRSYIYDDIKDDKNDFINNENNEN